MLWGICTWGDFLILDDRLISLFVLILFFFSLDLFLNNNKNIYIKLYNNKRLLFYIFLYFFILFNIFIILKFSLNWWNNVHQVDSFNFLNLCISFEIYLIFYKFIIFLFIFILLFLYLIYKYYYYNEIFYKLLY